MKLKILLAFAFSLQLFRNKINTKTAPLINANRKTPKTPTPKFKTVEITLNRENSIHQIAQELRNPPAESHTNQSEI